MADLKTFETIHQETTKQSIGKTIESPFWRGLEDMMRTFGVGHTKKSKPLSGNAITSQDEKYEEKVIKKRRMKV